MVTKVTTWINNAKEGFKAEPFKGSLCLSAVLAVLITGFMPITQKPNTDRQSAEIWSGSNLESLQNFRRRLGETEVLSWKAAKGPKVEHVKEAFATLNYDWESLLNGGVDVPRIILASVPHDLAAVSHIPEKKAIFFKTMLPLVLKVNEEITKDRKRLQGLHNALQIGDTLSGSDQAWLASLANRYGLDEVNTDKLLMRVDVIPVSLALAQSAEESGWGTSRFAREGNALFGQWTFSSSDKGIAPKKRDAGKSHRIKAFDSLIESVRAYALNLNKHRAYSKLRALRAQQRKIGHNPNGKALAATLDKYSERGNAYVRGIRAIISVNELGVLDDARLRNEKPVTVPSV